MQSLLQLSELPEMKTSAEDAETLDAKRKTPMPNERQLSWAVQVGDEESSRRPLPDWVSRPFERRISEWTTERKKWTAKIDERAAQGHALTPANERKYQQFLESKSRCQLLFSKKNAKVVHKLKNNAELKRMSGDLVSVEVIMAERAEDLRIKVGNGEEQRLVLLRGEPVAVDELPPMLAEAGASAEVAQAVLQGSGEDSESEADADVQEQKAMEEKENEIDCHEEVLLLSGDEEYLPELEMATSNMSRVKNFFHREAFRKLETQGLTQIPPGCVISYHKSTRTWQGYFEGKSIGLSSTHGGSTKRSEEESLLFVLLQLAERHVSRNEKDRLWKAQLSKLKTVSLTVAKL